MLQMPGLVKRRFNKLHVIICSRIKQTFTAKNTLSTRYQLTKPFMEVVKEECRLEILGGMWVWQVQPPTWRRLFQAQLS